MKETYIDNIMITLFLVLVMMKIYCVYTMLCKKMNYYDDYELK